jgi:tetratricopeptide (TPR) repeat protein
MMNMDRPVDPLDPDKHPGTDDQGSVSRDQPGIGVQAQPEEGDNALDGFSRRWFGIKLATWIIGIGCAIALLGWIQLHKTEANVRFLITEADQLEGQPGRKLALYRRALAGGYEPTARTYETMANASLFLSPPDRIGALDLLEKAGLEAPENDGIQIRLAYLYLDVENPGKALDHARIACELAPETAEAWQALTAAVKADALRETSLTRRAELLREGLNANRKRVELNPTDAVPYLESIRMFADLAYCIADAEAYQLEAELLAESLGKARDQLEGQIDNALNARPGEPQVLRDQATLALVTGDQETARKSLTQLLAKPEHSAWAATLLGWIEGNSDNLQRACELLRVAGSVTAKF